MSNWVDRFCCAPAPQLAHWGVTADNQDLLRPGPSSIAEYKRLWTLLRAQRLLQAGGQMTPDDFRDAIVAAMKMLGGEE